MIGRGGGRGPWVADFMAQPIGHTKADPQHRSRRNVRRPLALVAGGRLDVRRSGLVGANASSEA
jgi:hypothetical protein